MLKQFLTQTHLKEDEIRAALAGKAAAPGNKGSQKFYGLGDAFWVSPV